MLNNKQTLAVQSPANTATLILAGAGSGKTSVMAHRVVKLFSVDNIPAHKILGVTFTKKAALELAQRVCSLDPRLNAGTGGKSHGGALISTFHGAALQILRRLFAQREIFVPVRMKSWSIMDDGDQRKLIKDLIKLKPAPDGLFESTKDTVNAVKWFIDHNKTNMKRHKDIDERYLKLGNQYCNSVYKLYEQRTKKESLFDFNEIIFLLVEMMRDHAEIRQFVSSMWSHILVDEFQDTNPMQDAYLNLSLNGRECITVVGDDDQSIYGWRGSDPSYILKYAERFGGRANVITLEENYRSTQTILDAANQIIANNEVRHPKKLFTNGPKGKDIQYQEYANAWAEADEIGRKIIEDLENGYQPSDIAVLFRGNAQTLPLEKSFPELGLSYKLTGGLNFWAREEIGVAMAYARLAINPLDSTAFAKACAFPRRNIGAKKLASLEYKVATQGLTFAEALLDEKAEKARELGNILLKLEVIKDSATIEDFFEVAVKESGVMEFFRSLNDTDKSESKVDNLYALFEMASKAPENFSLEEFLEQAALTAEGNKKGDETKAIALSTIHGAKGLEWPKVYIVGMTQGLFPHNKSVCEGNLEEERRLAYVAFTRAKQELNVSYPTFDARGDYGQPSMFLSEAGLAI